MGVPRISSEISTGLGGKSPLDTLTFPIILANWFCWAESWLGMTKDARSADQTTALQPLPIRHPNGTILRGRKKGLLLELPVQPRHGDEIVDCENPALYQPFAHMLWLTPLSLATVEFGRSFLPRSRLKSRRSLPQFPAATSAATQVAPLTVESRSAPDQMKGSQCAPFWNAQIPFSDQPPAITP